MLNMQEKSFPDRNIFKWQKIAELMMNFDEIEIESLTKPFHCPTFDRQCNKKPSRTQWPLNLNLPDKLPR